MTQHELSKAKDKDLITSLIAIKRAAGMARKVAMQTGTAIVISENQKIVRRTAAQLQAAAESKTGSV